MENIHTRRQSDSQRVSRCSHFSTAHLLQFGERERVAVLGSELHEPHVGRVCELRDDAEAGEQPGIKQRAMLTLCAEAVMDGFNLCC